jgi:hypothetical protein
VKRFALVVGAAVLGILGLVAAAPTAQAKPLVCVKVSQGTAPPVLTLCLPPA